MFVKQIDMNAALELARKGREVKILVPPQDGGWEDMLPTTLQSMLDGCLFFRQELAMVNQEFEDAIQAAEAAMSVLPIEENNPPMPAEPGPPPVVDGADSEPSGRTEKPSGKCVDTGAKRQKVDTGKLLALRKAGWSLKKIGEELHISESTVWNYLKKLEEEEQDEGRNSNG